MSLKPKRYRQPRPKPGQLKIQWGKLAGEDEDMLYAHGGGPPEGNATRADGRFISFCISMPRPRVNFDGGCPQFDPSMLEELEHRGYDIKTLKFSIEKKGVDNDRQ